MRDCWGNSSRRNSDIGYCCIQDDLDRHYHIADTVYLLQFRNLVLSKARPNRKWLTNVMEFHYSCSVSRHFESSQKFNSNGRPLLRSNRVTIPSDILYNRQVVAVFSRNMSRKVYCQRYPGRFPKTGTVLRQMLYQPESAGLYDSR